MPTFYKKVDLNDPATDTTTQICGNSLFMQRANGAYREAYARAMEFATVSSLPGDVMEFGTYSGFTARILAEHMVKFGQRGQLLLFDSFKGFPASPHEADQKSLHVGKFKWWAEGGMPAPEGIVDHIFARLTPVIGEDRLRIYQGMFDTTMPQAVAGRKAAIVHIDCDLYASTISVLRTLAAADCLQDGTVLLFDDFYCNRANPNFCEQAALRDFLAEQPRWQTTSWFSYSWAAQAFFLHDTTITDQRNVTTAV